MPDNQRPPPSQSIPKEEAKSFLELEKGESKVNDNLQPNTSSQFFKKIAKDMEEAENSFTTMMLIRKEIEKAFKDLLS